MSQRDIDKTESALCIAAITLGEPSGYEQTEIDKEAVIVAALQFARAVLVDAGAATAPALLVLDQQIAVRAACQNNEATNG